MLATKMYALRSATEADYDFLYQLHRASMRTTVEATWGWDEAFQEEHFRTRWNPANRQIVRVGCAEVGVIILKESATAVFVSLIEIHPDSQGQGIGTGILMDIITDAHQRELPVNLHVLKANPKALRLYERLGFTITEEREERYVMTCLVDSLQNRVEAQSPCLTV